MISMSELVSRRLKPALGRMNDSPPSDAPPPPPTSYGTCRLGLLPIEDDRPANAAGPDDLVDRPAALPSIVDVPPSEPTCKQTPNAPAAAQALPGLPKAGPRTLPGAGSPGVGLVDAPKRQAPVPMIAESHRPPSRFRRSSFKLPRELHQKLRRHAKATGRFQYELMAEALEQYFASNEQVDAKPDAPPDDGSHWII